MYENSFTLTKMLAAYSKPLRFSGRSTRTELLGYLVISWLAATLLSWIAIGFGIVASISFDPRPFMTIDVFNLLVWLPFPALAIRRFHDQNKPGWWATPLVLSTILSWIGGFSLLSQPVRILLSAIYLGFLSSSFWKPTDGDNSYGPDPRLDPLGFGSRTRIAGACPALKML